MTDKPQLMTEEIELIPHPMDAWRAALNALIACAPGDGPAIAAHLAEARQQALVFVDRTPASAGTAKLIDRLMLLGAGQLVGQQLKAKAWQDLRNELGFSHHAPLLGIDFAAHGSRGRLSAAQPALASSAGHVAHTERLASQQPASSAPAEPGQRPATPAAQPGKASTAQAPEAAPQPAVNEPRPSGDSPCL
jgi:hypothetical protein